MAIPARILLADDDREVRLGVTELLSSLGLEVLQAEDGLEALELVRARAVQAALLDMHMPGRTGIEVVSLLRVERVGLPCIVYSGRWTPSLEQAVLDVGAWACLKKPVEPDVLRREVRRALAAAPQALWEDGTSFDERALGERN
jgi:two-component system response regulator MprA